jgi:hypothetical protein
MARGGTSRTTARMLLEAAARGADPEPRKCRLRTSKRNFAGREALAYPQTVSVTEGEHLPGGRRGHSVHIAADSGAVAVMPSERLATRIRSGSARFLSYQLVGSLSMGSCRRRGSSAWALKDWRGRWSQLRRLAPPRLARRTGAR